DVLPPSVENDDDSEEDIHFLEELLSDNSIPLTEDDSSDSDHQDNPSVLLPPLEPPDAEFIEKKKSQFLGHFVEIPSGEIKDGDYQREEIDIVTEIDDVLPPSVENDDDSEEDIHFLEELLSDNSIPLTEDESSDSDHQDNP
nr:hypothetical protein [Tanacetum cinerariifolium]